MTLRVEIADEGRCPGVLNLGVCERKIALGEVAPLAKLHRCLGVSADLVRRAAEIDHGHGCRAP